MDVTVNNFTISDEYFSEYALMKYRVMIEVEYFLFLAEKKSFTVSTAARAAIRKAAEEFSLKAQMK